MSQPSGEQSLSEKRVFIFKVALSDQQEIWRRIAVGANQTLHDLHNAIFDAFDREEEHLYSFYFPPPGAKGRSGLRNAVEYSHPYTCEEDPFGEMPHNAAETRLITLGLKPKQVFWYLFDFGDEWWHKITVEELAAQADKGKYPRILARHGESPPQYPEEDEEESEYEGEEDEDS